MSTEQSPYFVGAFSHSTDPTIPGSFTFHGDWLPHEYRSVTDPAGSVAMLGHCLASENDLRVAAENVLADGDTRDLTYLPGSYTSLIAQPDRMTVMTDLAGKRPVHYAHHDGRTLVSDNGTLLAEGMGATVDPVVLLARFACPYVPELTAGDSLWHGIHALEGGQRLTVTPEGSTVDTYDNLAPDPNVTFEETAVAVGTALHMASLLRLEQYDVVDGDLSGGFDSSSLACLTAALAPEPFHAFVFHNSSNRLSAGDLEHARRIAKACRNLTLHEIDTAGNLPYQHIDSIPWTDQPDPGALMPGARDYAYFRAIRELGGRAHLTGGCGDSLLTPSRNDLADAIRAGDLRTCMQHGVALARLQDVSPCAIWSQAVRSVRQNSGKALVRFALGLQHTDVGAGKFWAPESQFALDWLTPAAKATFAQRAFEKAETYHAPASLGAGDLAALRMLRREARTYHRSGERARSVGIDLHTPYTDHAYIRACTLLAAWKRNDPYAFKRLLATALKGMVPAATYERQTEGSYRTDLYAGLRQATPHLLKDSALADLGIIEPRRIRRILECLSTEEFPIMALNNLFASDIWLRQLDASRLPPSLSPMLPQIPQPAPRSEPRAMKPLPAAPHYVIPRHVYGAAALDNSLIFLNGRKRKYHTTSPTAGTFLMTLNACGGNITHALPYLQQLYPDIPVDKLRDDFMYCVTWAMHEGLLQTNDHDAVAAIRRQSEGRQSGSEESLAAWNKGHAETNTTEVAATMGAFTLALILKKLPLYWTPPLLNAIHTRWTVRDATREEAARAIDTTHTVTRWHPGRVACLEESLTANLALALRRRKAGWQVGVAFDYARPHASITVQGQPVTDVNLDRTTFIETRP